MSAAPTFPPTYSTVPTKDKLEQVAEAVLGVYGELDGMATGLGAILERHFTEGVETIRAKLPQAAQRAALGAIDDQVPRVDAAQAWHLHHFAREIRTYGEGLVVFADRIDEATLGLYGYTLDADEDEGEGSDAS